ncbi:MAG: SDR family oxidoreductase, partial [Pseudomonadota bacterium]|nr:SDR family oxidoreductase [Pseudomonadota bacterium]
VRVNAVCPGLIETRWHTARFPNRGDYEKFRAKYAENVALGKACSADDVAAVAVWLVEHGEMITGEMIKVDGGQHLGPAWRKR